MELALIGNLLVVVEGELGTPTPAPVADFETGDSHLVAEAIMYGAWIISHRLFPNDNREIGYEVLCQMLEKAGHPWPRPLEDAIAVEKMIEALENGAISEAKFSEWAYLRVATA